MPEEPKIKAVKFRIPKICQCPNCGLKQSFKKDHEHWKIVKDINVDSSILLKVRIVRAKCSNPNCLTRSFALPISGIEKYSRSTNRLKVETIAGVVEDNSTAPRMSARLNRCFNTTGSQSSIYNWKQKEADKYNIKEIIARLGFSGILTLDEYMPKRSDNYALIAGDAIKQRILYMETVPGFYGRGYGRGAIESFVKKLDSFGIKPWAIIFDLWAAFPKQVRKVWPDIIIQYDYFHIMQWIHKYLKNAIIQFRGVLSREGYEDMRAEIWEHKWRLLKNMDKWTRKDHKIIEELIETYSGTVIEKILIFKEELYNIFDASFTKEEAYAKRNALFQEKWWQRASYEGHGILNE